jgi:tetratricopeptide (TPR) repeat protein
MRAAKDYAKLTNDTLYQVLTMIRFGRFDEVLEVTQRPRSEVSGGMWDFAQGYASLKTGKADAARDYLDKVKKLADSSKASFRGNSAKSLLGIVGGILEGEIERTKGDLKAAIKVLEKAAELQEALQYDEPEALPFAAHHWLGAVLIEAKEFDRAEAVYRTDLKEHPRNGWSLLGLQQALAGRGVKSTTVDADFAASWSRSDTWIRASRF